MLCLFIQQAIHVYYQKADDIGKMLESQTTDQIRTPKIGDTEHWQPHHSKILFSCTPDKDI